MDVAIAGFDWDPGNRDKCRKHGVAIADIEAMFLKPVAVFPDPGRSGDEERLKAIGRGAGGRHIFVVFTLRPRDGETFVRSISARYMHRKEVAHYEEEIAKTAQRRGSRRLRRDR